MTRTIVVPAIAVLVVATAVALPGTMSVGAQSDPIGYSIIDEWTNGYMDWEMNPVEWPSGHVPGGLAVSDDAVVAIDQTANSLRIYALDGTFVRSVGGPGSGPGQFDAPRDVAVMPDGTIVVSDTGNDRLQILEADGTFVREWAVPQPMGIVARNRHGGPQALVISREQKAILYYNKWGVQLDQLELTGITAPEALVSHRDYRTDQAYTFYVVDPTHGMAFRVEEAGAQVFDSVRFDGLRAAVTTQPWGQMNLLLSVDGHGIRASSGRSRVVRAETVHDMEIGLDDALWVALEPEGLVSLPDADALRTALLDPLGCLQKPRHIAVGSDVVIGDALPRVQIWQRDGTPSENIALNDYQGRSSGIAIGDAPSDVAASQGNRYVLADNLVGRLEGGGFGDVLPPSAGDRRYAYAISAHDDRLATINLPGQEIEMFDRSLRLAGTWALGPGFRGVTDLALAADHVYLANQATSDLEVWSLYGALLRAVRVAAGPVRVAAGPDGDAFVLAGSGWVFRYGADGSPRGAWPAGPITGKPVDLAVDEDGRLYVADINNVIRVHAPDPGAQSQLPPPAGDHICSVLRNKDAEPPEIRLGETVEVRLHVDGVCPTEHKTADIVLVLDVSGSMGSDDKIESARDAALAFVASIDPLLARVGLVQFSGRAEIVHPLTTDQASVLRSITSLKAGGNTDLIGGLFRAAEVLESANPRPGADPVIVVMSDGHQTVSMSPGALDEVAALLRRNGIIVFSVALGGDADRETLARLASDPSNAYDSPTAIELRSIYVEIARRIEAALLFKTATVTDLLPGNMTFMPGTGAPLEPQVSPDGRTVTWHLTDVLEPGFRLSYRVRPEEAGLWPTNVEARTEYVDGFDNPGVLVFPVPEVRVIGPTPSPTPTASMTPTPSLTPSLTPTVTPSPDPSLTPTPVRFDAYLPLTIREHCDATWLHVTLAVDTSSSMLAPFAAGGATTKLDAARAAARAFVAEVNLERDSLGVVQFDSSARVVASGRDRAALEAAIDGLQTGRGTRIDLGLSAALADVTSAAERPGGRHVVMLMSDGRPEAGTAGGARAVAAALRADGVTLITVAVGTDADHAFLIEIADPGRAYAATHERARLIGIYERLAARLDPCEPSWRRDG